MVKEYSMYVELGILYGSNSSFQPLRLPPKKVGSHLPSSEGRSQNNFK